MSARGAGAIRVPTVLVIDDSPTERLLVGDCLRGAGYAVVEAGGGDETSASVARSPQLDLIVLDLILPDINGYDLYRALRADARTRETPIVMLTQRASEAEEYYGRSLGAAAYLRKPLQPDALLRKARRLAPV